MDIPPPEVLKKPLMVPNRTLMGAGPSNCSQRVLDAMSNPLVGHLSRECLEIMDEIKAGVKYMFQTKNPATFCISASGIGGMESALCNLLEDGDVFVSVVTGMWGYRAAEIAKRYGADVRITEARFGRAISTEEVKESLEVHRPKVFFIVQGDSSTGIYQNNIREIGELCRKYDALLIVDTVASLGGVEFLMDEWKVDVAFTGVQYVLSAPPGITPISFSSRAMQAIYNRNSRVKVYYWDAVLLADLWKCSGRPQVYHHTIAVTLLYALREALAIACDQGLKSLIRRHTECSFRLQKGLEDMGLELFIENPKDRLPTLTTIKIPKGVDWQLVAEYALKKYCLEIGGGVGPTVDIVFRVGVMGENATIEKVDLVLKILKEAIQNTSNFKLNEKSKI